MAQLLVALLPILAKLLPDLERLLRALLEYLEQSLRTETAEMAAGDQAALSIATGIDADALERYASMLRDISISHPDWPETQHRQYAVDALRVYLENCGRADLVAKGLPELLLTLNDLAKKLSE